MYVGDFRNSGLDAGSAAVLIEADLEQGVIAVSTGKYASHNTRICRPVGLDAEECRRVCDYMIERIGLAYDLKNVIDLARYLLPVPPVPTGWRRRMLALGSGDPTRAICSTLIAQAFQSIRYPILPIADAHSGANGAGAVQRKVTWTQRHYSLFAPRDFDISPYFAVVKPTLDEGFDFRHMTWSEPEDSDGG